MKFGLINKVAVTPANVSDAQGFKHICPKDDAVFVDKGYCRGGASRTTKRNRCVSKVILKNNMNGKDFEKDQRITKQRMPYEGVFSFAM